MTQSPPNRQSWLPIPTALYGFRTLGLVDGPTRPLRNKQHCHRRATADRGSVHSKRQPTPAWKTKPSWFLIAEEDRMINPKTQHFMADRMRAKVHSHHVDHSPMYTGAKSCDQHNPGSGARKPCRPSLLPKRTRNFLLEEAGTWAMQESLAIITGASQGMGRATAFRLARDFSPLFWLRGIGGRAMERRTFLGGLTAASSGVMLENFTDPARAQTGASSARPNSFETSQVETQKPISCTAMEKDQPFSWCTAPRTSLMWQFPDRPIGGEPHRDLHRIVRRLRSKWNSRLYR